MLRILQVVYLSRSNPTLNHFRTHYFRSHYLEVPNQIMNFFVTVLTFLILLVGVNCSLVTIPSFGEQESSIKDSEFVFDLAGSKPTLDTSGGRQFVLSRESSRALNLEGAGGTQVLFKFEPCGFRTPHYHPRGTESFHVIKGKVRANLLREAGGKRSQQAVVNDIKAGFSGFFPLAHIHFLQNMGCDEAETISMFGPGDEGVVDVAASFRFPRDTAEVTFGTFPAGPLDELINDVLTQSRECLRRCGLLKKKEKKPYDLKHSIYDNHKAKSIKSHEY